MTGRLPRAVTFCLIQTLCAFLVLFVAAPAHAQENRDADIRATTSALENIRSNLERGRIADAGAAEETLRALRDAARERLDPVTREIARAEADKAALGPPPAEGAPPETQSLRDQRAEIDARLAQLKSQEIQISANITEATELIAELSSARVRSLYNRIVTRGPSLLAPRTWTEAARSSSVVADGIAGHFGAWTAEKQSRGELALSAGLIAGAFLVFLLLFGPVNAWVDRNLARTVERLEPTPTRRIVVAGLKMLAHAAPGLVGGVLVLETLRSQGVIDASFEAPARAAWFALVAFLLVNGFVAGLFSTRNPKWRIAPLVAENGRRAGALLVFTVAIFGVKTVISELPAATNAGLSLDRLLDGASAIAIGMILFFLCRDRLWRTEAPEEKPAETENKEPAASGNRGWRFVRRAGQTLAVLTVIAPLAGYVAFADFVTSRVYLISLILAIAWFARALARETATFIERRFRPQAAKAADDEGGGFDLFWIHAAIDFMFVLALVPAFLVLAGYRWSFVRDFILHAFTGFEIAGVAIPSIAKILVAIGVFVGVIALTRLLQRGLARGPFAHSRIDPGVQNSLTTLIGYGGLIVALLMGVVSLGVNFASLAIIAGALSVGIGFGLQSIVNNFVSGLILLFERPIKVGDWIVTTAGEGTVKKISVRSTEIETFDRSSIIVPNSELISQTVTNWTHKDRIGRITVKVGVSYSADPEQVRDILLKCARDHPQVVRYPEPFVVWQDFGDSALNFEVRAFLRDISMGLGVRTDLRFAIFKAFKDAKIEIPFPQQDVHIRSMPGEEEKKSIARRRKPSEKPAETPPNEPELAEDD